MSVAVSIMIEGQQGLTWPRWQRLASEVEALGFAGLFRSDHFTDPQPPNRDSLEMMISLAYLASQTRRIHFGPCVAPVTFRDPVMLARQAMAIDDLSGGRMILGLGAGWQEREHHLFGYPLGDVATRMARFEEALEVVTRLVRSDAPEPFEGTFFQLREGAALLPRPARPGGTRIMIGGNGPKRTLPLAARYADIWNGVFLSLEAFGQRTALLDTLLDQAARPRSAVRRTLMTPVYFGRDEAELERQLAWRHERPELAGKPLPEALELMRARGFVVGGPEDIQAYLRACDAAGVDEVFLQWLALDDHERLAGLGAALGQWRTPSA